MTIDTVLLLLVLLATGMARGCSLLWFLVALFKWGRVEADVHFKGWRIHSSLIDSTAYRRSDPGAERDALREENDALRRDLDAVTYELKLARSELKHRSFLDGVSGFSLAIMLGGAIFTGWGAHMFFEEVLVTPAFTVDASVPFDEEIPSRPPPESCPRVIVRVLPPGTPFDFALREPSLQRPWPMTGPFFSLLPCLGSELELSAQRSLLFPIH